jgi:hypothetical protein
MAESQWVPDDTSSADVLIKTKCWRAPARTHPPSGELGLLERGVLPGLKIIPPAKPAPGEAIGSGGL